MNRLQHIGGLAALFEAAAFVAGFAVFAAVLEPARYGSTAIEPARHIAFLASHQPMMLAWNLVIYVAFGLVLVVLALALHERLKADTPALALVATALALIWAGLVIASGMIANIGMGVLVDLHATDPGAAAAVWPAYTFVVEGLGGGNEIVGGLWVLLISLAALRSERLPRLLAYLGIVAGGAGLLTTVPVLGPLGAVFGLGLIAWFAWLGIVLPRGEERGAPATGRA